MRTQLLHHCYRAELTVGMQVRWHVYVHKMNLPSIQVIVLVIY